MLKRSWLALTLACFFAALSTAAFSQDAADQQAPPAGEGMHHGHGRMDPARRAAMLNKQLNLTSDQQPKVLNILKDEQSQMEKLHSDSSVSQEDRRSRMMTIHKTSNDQIRALLDSDQQKKFDEIQSRREQWMGHHDGPPSDSAPNPPEQK
ncbi:MAG TPA: hypothetical protein VKV39_12315 [Candidatus Sulfotelmatobacter sp.]|nr:hypothetical protein [Candidatus Sulfotelmatobacter sp.]